MHKRIFKRLKNYKAVEEYFQSEIKDVQTLEIVKDVLYEDNDENQALIEEKDKVKFIKFYRSGSCELCYEEYIDETKTKLEEWKENPPDFRDQTLQLEIIIEVKEK
ncbi:hypothetical protein SAMN02745164_00974 [Marinitoga hydrogenitolerans DSM 16785]|uniref:Uncharacterized protein n=1 Tax=Marinitoga hydrogenitolerans (strain DSM 16785 / JCM 12826 / AT1271) TaxID=1122195 RepID=A0A1M4VP76_MARH1|nr:hypothetical protein [Marinitoga hydrogenitolerans]SHE70738.1 hypothetical protein SAMN02745164_00974 [Marinitoga hydrogenitolerans DSM 16785]